MCRLPVWIARSTTSKFQPEAISTSQAATYSLRRRGLKADLKRCGSKCSSANARLLLCYDRRKQVAARYVSNCCLNPLTFTSGKNNGRTVRAVLPWDGRDLAPGSAHNSDRSTRISISKKCKFPLKMLDIVS